MQKTPPSALFRWQTEVLLTCSDKGLAPHLAAPHLNPPDLLSHVHSVERSHPEHL